MYNYTSKIIENVTHMKDNLTPDIKEKLQSKVYTRFMCWMWCYRS